MSEGCDFRSEVPQPGRIGQQSMLFQGLDGSLSLYQPNDFSRKTTRTLVHIQVLGGGSEHEFVAGFAKFMIIDFCLVTHSRLFYIIVGSSLTQSALPQLQGVGTVRVCSISRQLQQISSAS
jgi:hypothetical protein